MKKFLLVSITFFFIVSLAHAQITKGSLLLGGSVSANTNETESGSTENKSNGLYIRPAIGLTVKENTVVGLRGGYSHSKTQYNGPYAEQKTYSYSIGTFVRRYLPLGKGFYLFGEAGVDYDYLENSQPNGNDSKSVYKGKTFEADLYPGIAYAVSKKIHLEASINNLINLSYLTSKTEYSYVGGQTVSKTKGFSFGSNASSSVPLNIGFRFVLGK
jgi:hypothetical protein